MGIGEAPLEIGMPLVGIETPLILIGVAPISVGMRLIVIVTARIEIGETPADIAAARISPKHGHTSPRR